MKRIATNLIFALALMLSLAAFGQTGGSASAARGWDAQVYGDLGLTFWSVSVGDASYSRTNFGLTAGGKLTWRVADAVSVGPLANISLVFPSGGTLIPITGAGVVTFAGELPVELTLGLGFTYATSSDGGSASGVSILGQALYPLPGLPLGVHLQLEESVLSGMNLFQFTAGLAYRF